MIYKELKLTKPATVWVTVQARMMKMLQVNNNHFWQKCTQVKRLTL